jgi:ribonuclease HI
VANVEYTSDLPTDAHAELNAIQQGFRDRAKREEERFRLTTDSEYWFVLGFKDPRR